jgi:hypothetical protein
VNDLAEKEDWNILERPWLEVSTHRGAWHRASPLEVLRRSPELRALGASSAVDEFAATRFLTTLLYWKADAGGGIAKLRARLSTGEMPAEVVDAIAAERDCFFLFDPKRPFLQDSSINDDPDKPVGSLFAEIATGTNIAHFDHSKDLSSPLCITCVARGMLRLVPWSQSGGRGLRPSIHGAPPIALLPRGVSLAETLAGCMTDPPGAVGVPTWSGTFRPDRPDGPIPLLEGLTWNPRRVRIPRPDQESRCGLCGAFGPVVSAISFKVNDAVKKIDDGEEKQKSYDWRDPAFLYRPAKSEPVRSSDEKAASTSEDLRWLRDARSPTPQGVGGVSVIIPCTNPANNKSFDHRRVALPAGADPHTLRVAHDGASGLELQEHPLNLAERGRSSSSVGFAVERFLTASIAALQETDWIALRRALGRTMHDDPEAFAVFSAVYWRVRSGGRSALRRDAAWTLLKLFALAPASRRAVRCSRSIAEFLDALPARQAQRTRSDVHGKSAYPIAGARGSRLENQLAAVIEADLASDRAIPWLELGTYLNHAAR